jgi:hypothetical protein
MYGALASRYVGLMHIMGGGPLQPYAGLDAFPSPHTPLFFRIDDRRTYVRKAG